MFALLMFESPFIPGLNALLEQRKVGCICHLIFDSRNGSAEFQ